MSLDEHMKSAAPTAISPARKCYRRRRGAEVWQTQLRKGSLALAVLAVLWEEPLDLSTVRRRLAETAGITIVDGVAYPILRRLRIERLIETQWVEVEIGHPRRYYRLTTIGREHALELSRRWTQFTGGMNRVLESLSAMEVLNS